MTHSDSLVWRRRRVPLILQTEAAECGLACLAMLCRAHGHDTDLLSLRRRFEISSRGATLGRLMEIAERLGFASRALRLELHELADLRVPCILHWDLNHFVVLTKVGRQRITVLDPALGERRLTLDEAGKHFTGVAMELIPAAGFQRVQERTRLDLRVLFAGQSGLRRTFAQVFALSLVLELLNISLPMLSQWIIDDVVVSRDAPLLAVLCLSVCLLAGLSLFTRLLRSWTVLSASLIWRVGSSTSVFRYLLRLPLSFFEKRHPGDTLSRFGSVDRIHDTVSHHLVEAVLDGLVGVLTLGLLFVYSPVLAAVVLASAVLHVAVRLGLYGPYRRAEEELIVRTATAQSYLMETLRGMPAIKFFAKPGWRVSGWLNQQVGMTNAAAQKERISLLYQGITGTLGAVEQSLVLFLAATMILEDRMSIGMLVAFLAYKSQFLQRTAELTERVIHLRLLRLHGERLADIVLGTPEPESTGLLPTPAADQPLTLELEDVHFSYGQGEAATLHGVDLRLRTGRTVAVVGPSGCGKSTLLKIVSGQVEPDRGEVRLEGVPIRRLGMDAFRSLIGTVLQDDQLFSCSIYDNIAMNDAEASADKVARAARTACVHDDIMAMPMGYQTLVGGMGSTVSGGQKQRILLARALYKQPRFLLLDEYTSHLDTETEARVIAATSALGCGRLIITHRQHPLAPGDERYTLVRGRLVGGVVQAVTPAIPTLGSPSPMLTA